MSSIMNNTLFQSECNSWKIQQQCKMNNTRLGLFIKMVHIDEYKDKKDENCKHSYLKKYQSNKDQINFLLSRKRQRKRGNQPSNYQSIRLCGESSYYKKMIHSNSHQKRMRDNYFLKQRCNFNNQRVSFNNATPNKTKSNKYRFSMQKTCSSVEASFKKNTHFTIDAAKNENQNPQDHQNIQLRVKTQYDQKQQRKGKLKFNYSNKSINSLTKFEPIKNKVQRKYLLKTVSKKMKVALLNTRSFHRKE